jgi:hypothetical protein
MSVRRMAVATRFELVKFVCCVWRVADKGGKVKWGQLD